MHNFSWTGQKKFVSISKVHSYESQVCDNLSQLFSAVRTLELGAVSVPVRKTAAMGLRHSLATEGGIDLQPVQYRESRQAGSLPHISGSVVAVCGLGI